jgi:hypothetical protein
MRLERILITLALLNLAVLLAQGLLQLMTTLLGD